MHPARVPQELCTSSKEFTFCTGTQKLDDSIVETLRFNRVSVMPINGGAVHYNPKNQSCPESLPESKYIVLNTLFYSQIKIIFSVPSRFTSF